MESRVRASDMRGRLFCTAGLVYVPPCTGLSVSGKHHNYTASYHVPNNA